MNDTPTVDMFHGAGFTLKESLVLDCLKDVSASQSDIVNATGLCQCGISQILKGLVQKGCVEIFDSVVTERGGRPTSLYRILMTETLKYAEKQIVDHGKDIERLKQLSEV